MSKVKHIYHLESYHLDKWLRFKYDIPLQYAQGWLDCYKNNAPRLHTRLMRSDGKIIQEVEEHKDVSIGMIAGWPSAQQYEAAAQKALEKAREIREREKKEDERREERRNERKQLKN